MGIPSIYEAEPLQLVSAFTFVGSLVVTINSFLYYVILNFDIEDWWNLILNWTGCIGGLMFAGPAFLINLKIFDGYDFILGIIEQVGFIFCFNGFTIMFIRQGSIFFNLKMTQSLWAGCLVLNIYNIIGTYYSLRYQLFEEEQIYVISHGIDCAQTVIFFTFEFISNIYGIYTIVRAVRKLNNVNINRLVIKMVAILILFVILDFIIMIFEIFDMGEYTYCIWGFNYAVKSQIEYYCLGKVRQCILVAQCHYNSHN
jgi:hypothetical protein